MKPILILIAVLLASASQAQLKMTLSINGQVIGTAAISQKLDQAGHLKQSIHMSIDFQGIKSSLDTDVESDATGRPILETSTQSQGTLVKTTTLTYGAKSLEITDTENGKPQRSTVAYPKGSLSDASTIWFVTVKPDKKATTTFIHYDEPSKSWQTKSATYVGDETVPETDQKGHHIHHDDGDIWLDDKGLPIRIELSQMGAKLVLKRI